MFIVLSETPGIAGRTVDVFVVWPKNLVANSDEYAKMAAGRNCKTEWRIFGLARVHQSRVYTNKQWSWADIHWA